MRITQGDNMLEIPQNDQKLKIMCQTFYVEGVARIEKSRYPASRLIPLWSYEEKNIDLFLFQ